MIQSAAAIPFADDVYYSVLGADPDLAEIVTLFVEEMPARIRDFRAHFASSNWDQLARLAHQLKGAAGSYGFDQITPFAALLEKSICNGEPQAAIGAALDEVVKACGRVRAGPHLRTVNRAHVTACRLPYQPFTVLEKPSEVDSSHFANYDDMAAIKDN